VLERQCSLAKHQLALHERGSTAFGDRLASWQAVSRAREALPASVRALLAARASAVRQRL